MVKFFSSILIVLTISLQTAGQCGGYFKEQNRQIFSNAFNFGHFEDMDNDGLKDLPGISITSMTGGSTALQISAKYRRNR